MKFNQVKEILKAIGYPVKGSSWNEILDTLYSYDLLRADSTIEIDDASPLYTGVMVDSKYRLRQACIQIKKNLEEKKATEECALTLRTTISIFKYLLENAHNDKQRKCSFDITCVGYITTPWTQVKKSTQIIDDLLSDDKELNFKASQAIKAILTMP